MSCVTIIFGAVLVNFECLTTYIFLIITYIVEITNFLTCFPIGILEQSLLYLALSINTLSIAVHLVVSEKAYSHCVVACNTSSKSIEIIIHKETLL